MRHARSRAPGRVNIIGEHTDYNDGFVLPCAIAYDTQVYASERPDRIVSVRSRFDDPGVFDIDRLPGERHGAWTDYVRGILSELRTAGIDLRGADLEITGTVPLGAGLSSSASFEVALALAFLALAQVDMPPIELARIAQRAEVEYAGTRCGIMDQFTVLAAREGYALLLDTRTLEYRHIAVPAEVKIVICNTMVKHDLALSAYNERRSECERSVSVLRELYPDVRALRDVGIDQLMRAQSRLSPVLFARAKHVVTENVRVIETAEALESGDLARVGMLMYASHESLRADYAVSSAELDTMVRLAKEFEGTIGARMTGGGFGGCTVNLVHAQTADDFGRYIASAYQRETGIVAEIYDGTPSAGASVQP